MRPRAAEDFRSLALITPPPRLIDRPRTKMAPAFGRGQFTIGDGLGPGIGKSVRAEVSIITSPNDVVGSMPDNRQSSGERKWPQPTHYS
jgi:hypothetical protein